MHNTKGKNENVIKKLECALIQPWISDNYALSPSLLGAQV